MAAGWIKLHRKTLTSPMWQNANAWRFFEWCLLRAVFVKTTIFVGYQEVVLQPGQLLYGRRMAHKETGLSEQTIRTCVHALSTGTNPAINHHATNRYSIITILNWDAYQGGDIEDNPQLTRQPTNSQPTSNPQLTTKEEVQETKKPTPRARDPVSGDLLSLGREVIGLTPEAALEALRLDYADEWILIALKRCAEKGKKGRMAASYARGILQEFQRQGGPDNGSHRHGNRVGNQPADYSNIVNGEKL